MNIPEPQHDALSAPGLDGTIVTSNQILRYRGELYRLTSAGVRQRRAYAVTEPTNTELEYLIACVVAGDSSHTLNFDQLQRTLVNH